MPPARRRALPAAAAAAVLALLTAACGGGQGSAERPETLEEALGLGEQDVRARAAEVQEAIRRCMQDQGFDYVPMDSSQLNIRVVGRDGIDDPGERATRGYGIATGDGPLGGAVTERGGGGTGDPNQAIRQALGEADREAYDRALFGRAHQAVGEGEGRSGFVLSPGAAVAEAGEPAGPADQGCFGAAQAEVGGNAVERIGPALRELQERVDADPRLVAVNAEWSRCMTDAGYSFDTPDEIVPYLFRRLQEATGGGRPGAPVIRTPDVEVTPELAALQREELALAAADDACAAETGRAELAEAVRAEVERQFLEDNPDLGRDEG